MELDTEHQLKQQTTMKALLSQRLPFWINLTEEEQKELGEKTGQEQKIILNLLKWINLHLLLQIIAVRSIKL